MATAGVEQLVGRWTWFFAHYFFPLLCFLDPSSGFKCNSQHHAPNKNAISRGLCFSIHLSLHFASKTTPPRSIFLDSTCGLPKGLEANAPAPASNGHCWSRAVSGKVDLDFCSLPLPPVVFSLSHFMSYMHQSAPWLLP